MAQSTFIGSSTSMKSSGQQNQIKDAAFQKIAAANSGPNLFHQNRTVS
jgi:hypothetical protein